MRNDGLSIIFTSTHSDSSCQMRQCISAQWDITDPWLVSSLKTSLMDWLSCLVVSSCGEGMCLSRWIAYKVWYMTPVIEVGSVLAVGISHLVTGISGTWKSTIHI